MTWPRLAFFMLAALILVSAYRVATARLITHAALFLASTFVGVAGVFFLLQADFLAAVQLLIYAGAVMTVMIFAVMLSQMRDLGEGGGAQAGLFGVLRSPFLGLLPLAVSGVLFAVLMVVYGAAAGGWPRTPVPAPADSTAFIGHAVFRIYALPFEVASVLLLGAMIGAIILTRREGVDRG